MQAVLLAARFQGMDTVGMQSAQQAFASWMISVLLIIVPLIVLGALVIIALAVGTRGRANLINCPDCGGGVSPHAETCPQCGRKMK